MSKKIISAILVMAMVISMSATALLSSVGAAAETDYEADRTTLKASIQNLVIYGPTLTEDTYDFLKSTGILTFNDDLNCNCGCGEWVELHNRNSFWNKYITETYKVEDFLFVKTGAERTEAIANIEETIEKAAAAYYFGKEANDGLVDPSFNAGRNEIVKAAIKSLNDVIDSLKAEVGENDKKPAGYAAYFMGANYKGFATYSKAYNQAIGFNPYLFIISEEDYSNDTYWNNALGQYTIRWYTFAEAREIDANGVFAFEKAIREIALNNGAKVLFWDFIANAATPFETIVKDLFTNLVGDIKDYFVYEDIDVQIKAFYELEKVIEIYDLYIKDVYNNIYTASAAELLNDVLYAKRVIEFVRGADDNKIELVALALTDFNAMTADIKAEIKAVAPRAEQLLSADDITSGTALIRKAEALLSNWSNWASIDALKGTWNALNTAKNNLKNMMPATVGGSTIIVVEKDTFGNIKNFAGTEIKNDRVIVEFTPNWFAFVKFSALLEAQIKNFTDTLNKQNGTLGEIDLGKDDADAFAAILNKYAFLAGIVGNVVEVKDGKIVATTFNKDASLVYSYYVFEGNMWAKTSAATNANEFLTAILHYEVAGVDEDTCFYESVIGNKLGNNALDNNVDQDMAIENAYYFVDLYEEILRYALANNFASTGEFAWSTESWTFKSEVAKKIEALEAALKNLTKDITIEVQTYAWILKNIVDVMDWDLEKVTDNGIIDGIFNSNGTVDGYAALTVEDANAIIAALTTIRDTLKVEYIDTEANNGSTVSLNGVVITGVNNGVVGRVDATYAAANDMLAAIKDVAINDVLANYSNDLLDTVDEINGYLLELDKVMHFAINGTIVWTESLEEKLDAAIAEVVDINSELTWEEDAVAGPCYTSAANYPKDYMKNTVAAAEELAKLIAEVMTKWNGDDKKMVDVAINTNLTNLVATYNKFIDAFKANILTEAGAAKLDKFIEDTYYVAEAALKAADVKLDWNQYDMLLQKLNQSGVTLNNYLADAKNCYQYFAVTLKHVVDCDKYFTNLYLDDNGAFVVNFVNPLADLIKELDITGYTRDWSAKFQAAREVAAYVYASLVNEGGYEYTVNSDMPVWFAERVLAETKAAYAEKDNYTTAKLVEYKAGLEALLREADSLNVYNYVSNTDEAKAIWADFVAAYTNAQYVALDSRVEFAKVDEAVAALTAAMAELEKIEAVEGAATVDTLNAKIADAKALLARADKTAADKTELELAIAAAEKVVMFNISVLNSTDIDAEIKVLNDLMNALEKEMYTGADLKKAVKVLELQVVVDLYTEASYRKFANAVESAYAMAEEDTATESAMMAAYANVEARFGDLKLAPVEEEPEVVEPEVSVVMTEAIEIYNNAANGYDKAVEGCTAESAAAYNAAINTLKADIENNADDAKLLESIIALNLAKAALTVDVPETCDC